MCNAEAGTWHEDAKHMIFFTRKAKAGVILGVTGTVAFVGIGIWTGNENFFQEFISPVLARVDPELSHKVAVILARYYLQRSCLLEDPSNLKTKFGSFEFANPIGVAAGFDKNRECMSGLRRAGYGWIEIGSVTPVPQEGNDKPRVFRLPQDSAIINRYGFNNDGHERVYKRVLDFKIIYPDYIVGVNLGANKNSPDRISDYCKGVEKFNSVADYFVINVSSPNTPNLRDLQKSDSLLELLRNVIQTRDTHPRRVPVYLKVAPDISDSEIKTICKTILLKDTKVDGLIISNTTVKRDNLESSKYLAEQTGGLSGRPLERVSTLLVAKFYAELKGQVPIIGVGGVCNGKDAFAKIQAGASAVQIYTVLAYKGLGVVHAVKKELSEILEKQGYKSISEAVGTLHEEEIKSQQPSPTTKRKVESASSGAS